MIDETVDASLDAIALLCDAAIKGDLGVDNIRKLFKQPTNLQIAGMDQMPWLAIYIKSEQRERMSSVRLNDNLIVHFDYMRPPGSVVDRDPTYPPLRHVWRSIANVLEAGLYSTVNSGADVLCAAGMDVREDTPEVMEYGYDGKELYPFFQAKMLIEFTPAEVDFSTLKDYLIHFTGWDQPGGDAYSPAMDDTTNLLGTKKVAGEIQSGSDMDGTLTSD